MAPTRYDRPDALPRRSRGSTSSPAACRRARPTSCCGSSAAPRSRAGGSCSSAPTSTTGRPASTRRAGARRATRRCSCPRSKPVEILSLARERDVDLVGIEEAQFFDPSLVPTRRDAAPERAPRHRERPQHRLRRPPVRPDAGAARPGRRHHDAQRDLRRLRRDRDPHPAPGGRPPGGDRRPADRDRRVRRARRSRRTRRAASGTTRSPRPAARAAWSRTTGRRGSPTRPSPARADAAEPPLVHKLSTPPPNRGQLGGPTAEVRGQARCCARGRPGYRSVCPKGPVAPTPDW